MNTYISVYHQIYFLNISPPANSTADGFTIVGCMPSFNLWQWRQGQIAFLVLMEPSGPFGGWLVGCSIGQPQGVVSRRRRLGCETSRAGVQREIGGVSESKCS